MSWMRPSPLPFSPLPFSPYNESRSPKSSNIEGNMFCPVCEAEYEPGITRCADDGAELVGRLTPENTLRDHSEARFVPLHNVGSPAEAEMVADILTQNGVRAAVQAGGPDALSPPPSAAAPGGQPGGGFASGGDAGRGAPGGVRADTAADGVGLPLEGRGASRAGVPPAGEDDRRLLRRAGARGAGAAHLRHAGDRRRARHARLRALLRVAHVQCLPAP